MEDCMRCRGGFLIVRGSFLFRSSEKAKRAYHEPLVLEALVGYHDQF
jgi:hypothetical protein